MSQLFYKIFKQNKRASIPNEFYRLKNMRMTVGSY